MTPEARAREEIDRKLDAAGWILQDVGRINLAAGAGIAVREYPTDTGPADYVLFVNRKAVGVIEAKRDSAGENLSVAEGQSERYASAMLKWRKDTVPLRFLYVATGQIVWFTDAADPLPRARELFHFFKPETLAEWAAQPDTLRERLRHMPALPTANLRDCQISAVTGLEQSLVKNKPRALIHMATGAGKTFICRADDGQVYFVKGRFAGVRSLVCEWLAGSLAKTFGLPIAPFAILDVPEALVRLGHAAGEPLSDLGAGAVFGSQRCEFSELTMISAELVPEQTRADVAVFDWWVHNEDRTLSARGGNPNLFWEAGGSKLWVIDHNLAFDADFSRERFLDHHVFADALRGVASDFVARKQYANRLSATLTEWHSMVAALPAMWQTIDPEQSIPLDFDFAAVRTQLEHCTSDAFWNLS
ncbi:MAG: DEAD/DEAH box helicase family protein [Rudaea sp.]|uniref:HipA family kinase n=1 Tax=Rudaea sp. TaxID=2136325 RepID=UPI0039E68832